MEDMTFTNSEGIEWDSVAASVHEFMCPDTGRACHSLCMCYMPEFEKDIERRRQRDGVGACVYVATCKKYDVNIYD